MTNQNQKATKAHNHNFYKELFANKVCKDDPTSIKHFLNGISLKQVTQEENQSLKTPIQLHEIAHF